MSRFEEVVNEAIGEVVLRESTFRAEELAQQIAELVRERQGALRAEVTIAARYPEHKPAPVSGVETQEIYTLHGARSPGSAARAGIVGVAAQGMTACPCAQELVGARGPRAAAPTTASATREIDRIFEPCRSRPTTSAGSARCTSAAPRGCRSRSTPRTLLAIVEDSMSSEIYELMKRSDEVEVVEKAHRRPRFVEDCVREMISGVVARFPTLREDTLRVARQENLETIHQHNVLAERHGAARRAARRAATAASTRRRHTTMREWLDAAEPARPRLLAAGAVAPPARARGAVRRSSPGPTAP